MPDIDDYMWVGSGPAPDCSDANEPGMCDNPWNLTEEQLEEERRQIKEENEAYLEWALMERRKANAASAMDCSQCVVSCCSHKLGRLKLVMAMHYAEEANAIILAKHQGVID